MVAASFQLAEPAPGLETVVKASATGQAVAWFPLALDHLATHPSGRTWAGGAGSYLCLITLEGKG